jgi:hypothetical protein
MPSLAFRTLAFLPTSSSSSSVGQAPAENQPADLNLFNKSVSFFCHVLTSNNLVNFNKQTTFSE